ncbi:MAG: cupin domain-containing protein [Colwellia sp.]
MLKSKIIQLNANPEGFGEVADELEQSMFASSLPVQHSHDDFEDEDLGLYVGVWDTTDMVEAAGPYACHEFMTVIEGSVDIKNNVTGKIETVVAGQSFVIPKDYDCQWQQTGYLRKFYVIYEPEDEQPSTEQPSGIVIISENKAIAWQETSDGHRKKVLFSNESGTFVSGVWNTNGLETGEIQFPYNEFFTIKTGNIVCTEIVGDKTIEHEFKCGSSVFIPKDTACSWKISTPTTLHFVQIK